MRPVRLLVPLIAALGVCLISAASAFARTDVTKPACATPAGYSVIRHDSDTVLFKSRLVGGEDQDYRYCVRSDGRKFPIFFEYAGGDVPTITGLVLNGDYFAYTVTDEIQDSSLTGTIHTRVVNVVTGKNEQVPDPLARSSSTSNTYSSGCCSSVVLSPSGVLASVEELGDDANDTLLGSFVIAFQASTDTSVILGSGTPGSLSDVQIFGCAAGCSSTTSAVVGWLSSGSQEYAAVPTTG